MKLPSAKMIVLNGAAVMVIGTAVATQIRSLFEKPVVASCATYYENAVGLGLERSGQLVTAVDVQAGASGADYGVLENLTTVRLQDGPAAAAMVVNLGEHSTHPNHSRETRGGIAFPWRPRSLPASAPTVCLSYHVKLPADFAFGTGIGTLPGVSGSSQDATSDEVLNVYFGWGPRGHARMRFWTRTGKAYRGDIIESEVVLPRGRWFRIDQEIGLNAKGEENGMLRFWIDGEIAAENWKVNLRSTEAVKFEGILADVYFGASQSASDGRAVKNETVMLSPFELRWRK